MFIKSKKNSIQIVLKKKLKKKWKFWRLFKNFFLKKKQKFIFIKLQGFINRKRIIWKQFSKLYGNKIKNLVFKNIQSKIIFNSKFYEILNYFECRLNIILFRMGFISKILKINDCIKKNLIFVNGKLKTQNYLVKIGDMLQAFILLKKINFLKYRWFYKLKWRKFKWKRWKDYNFLNKLNFFFITKKNLILNYVEINYKIFNGILLRKPLMGEIILNKNKKLVTSYLIKKIYFIY